MWEAEMAQDVAEGLPRPSLYDRLGGVYNIATVVDDLIDRIMIDPRLNANPRVDEAHHRVSAAGFKYYVTEWRPERARRMTKNGKRKRLNSSASAFLGSSVRQRLSSSTMLRFR